MPGASAIDYIALHGSVAHGDGAFDFSPVEIASSFERDKDKWFGYISRIQSTPTLYWGYRLEDAGVLQALAKESTGNRPKADSWITLRKSEPEAIEYYQSLGFQIIVADTADLLKYIGQLQLPKVAGAPKSLLAKNFREYHLPPAGSVPVRSLTEFYLGADPTWFDIHSGKIYQTRYFSLAKNTILGGKHLMIVGAAVTGKSTLLKQLANWLSSQETILFIDEITPEKARLLIRDLDAEGQKVIIFVDNAADASEAIQILIASSNVRIVCAERDYIFDSVSYRFPQARFDILDVSGLSPMDAQAVQQLIPNDIQRKTFEPTSDHLEGNSEPTFFEVITSTITADSLADRFMAAVRSFRATKPMEHDLLLVACYLYSCRIPTSVDIATAFARRFASDVTTVLSALESMGNLLSAYEGALSDASQSYFVPRSRAVAEAVLWKIESSQLRRVLEIFHEEVSPTKIGRYDVFRRNAYDARIVARAFPDWEDGVAFYNSVSHRDQSYSFKQQCALYLSNKRQYELAFSWVDDALAMAGRNNPTVRNTYAVILFNANYDKPEGADVMATLDESMSILSRCYNDDYRKIYHSKVYSEQAMKYQRKFPTSIKVRSYLDQSNVWLAAELKNRPGDRRLIQLSRQIRSVLRGR